MNKKMSFIPSFFKALALVVCLMWNFLSHAVPLNTPIFSVSFSPTTIGPGSVSTMTYTIDNSAQATGVSGLTFTNTLPAGMTIASPAVALNTCLNGSYVSTPGSNVTSFSDYRLGAGASCSFQVDVTSTTAGSHTNTTGALSTSAGSAGTSSAILTVDDNRPGFSMAFSPAIIAPGAISTLTYTIDNSANSSNAFALYFTHSLPTGLTFSEQPNITNSCTASVVAQPSSSTLTSQFGPVSAGSTCTVSVDVTAPSAGVYQTKSIDLSQSGRNPSGQASTELTVGSSFMFMTFPNASAPGTTVDLTYTINNLDRVNAAENISFTNDLNATLSGLTATALPSDGFCGSGSSLTIPSPILDINGRSTGLSPITVTGANLSAEASCTFKVSVLIPTSAAAGNYTNTTSVINLTLGSATTKAASTNILVIKKAPQVSMSFLNNPVNSGENTTLRYVVTNTDTTNSATNLGFTMPINSIVSGMVTNTLPTANTCGVGSTFSDSTDDGSTRYFKFADGTIPAGGSCTFDLVLTLPADNSSANYLLTTSTIAGTVNGDTVYGNQAQDTLSVMSAAKLSLAIVEEQIVPGGQVTLEFTLDYSESAAADVSNLAFTVDLNTVLSGLTAVSTPSGDVCGAGSTISGSSILTFSSGSLSSASQCTFSVTLLVPNNATPSTITLTSSAVTGSSVGQAVNSAAASDTLVISALHLTKSFSPDVVLAGDIISLTYTLTNSSADATLISFTDSMSSVINSFQAITLPTDPCGVGSSITGTTSLTFAGGNLDSGASCTFIVALQVPAGAADGVYNSVTSNVNGTVNGSNTSSVAATATLEVQSLTALLTSTAGNPTASNPILVNINFSRDVVNFTVNDLVVNNATLANFSGSGNSYQVDLTPSSNGEVTVDLPANSVDDLVDNNVTNSSSNQLSLVYNNNAFISVLVPAANIQVQGSSFNISGTSPTEGMVIYLYSDNNNDGVVDNNTALASTSVNGGSWTLDATVTLGNANNFLVGNQTTRAIEVIDIPTITEITNFAPVISGSPGNVAVEDSVYTFTPTVTDTNSSDTQTFSISNKPTWATFSTTTGALTGTPTNADVGTTSGIVISVADSANVSDSLAAFNLTVTNTNDTPVITGTPATTVAEDAAYSFIPTVSDVDTGDTQTFSINIKPTWATFSTTTGALTGTPTNVDVGITSGIVISVADAANASVNLAAFSLTVTNTNDGPVITGIPATTVAEDAAYSFIPTVSDVDAGDTQTFSISNKPTWATFSTSTGGLTGTPVQADIGTTSGIVISVADAANATVSLAAFNLTVSNTNDAPVITGTPATTVAEDAAYSFIPTVSDVDVGDTQTFSISNKPTWATFSTSTGGLTGTPTNVDVGITSGIVISVADSANVSVSLAAFSLTVTNTNDAPVITGAPATTAVEDAAYSFTPIVSDVDAGDTQTFSISNKPTWATFSTTTGALTGSPSNVDLGTTSGIVISVADAANATVSLAAFNLTVSNTNDAPVITGTPATTVAEDSSYNFIPTVSDVDAGDTQTFSISNKPTWATFSTSTGGLTGTPTNVDVGITSGIVISVADSANASVSLAAFSLTVTNTNDAPVITGTPATTVAEEDAYSFTPTVTDDIGDTQTFSITNIPSWATFNTLTGALTGTPSRTDAADYAGIVIIVTDNASTIGTLPTFTITVTNSNEAPVADAQTLILEEDSELSIILSAEDPDGDELTYAIVTEPEHGSLVQSPNNIWVYTADKDFNGTDNFTYKALDAETDSEPVTVELTINPVNDAPVAQDDNIVLTYSESGRYNLDVLNNDSDVDGDVLSIINASSAIGNASIEAGELIFQMQGVFEGEIKLQYAISDGNAVKDNDNSKANVTLVFDNHIDALLPVITLPQDIDINARALFTKVDLGVASAINSQGGSVPVSLVDGITRFAPGNNLVYWQAQDSDGFKRVVTQRVTVQPLVNIAVDSQGTEGAHYKVAVHLNGESPTYPVIIPYSVSGDADSNDHDLLFGELIINSGLLGYIEFDTFSDGVVEADEVVVITLDDNVNLGAKSVFTLTITEGNIAPQASITVSQDNEQRTLIDKTLGEVVITSEVFDANNDDKHSYTWMSVSGVLVDSDTEDTSFTFDPTNVTTGQQILSLNVIDNGESPLSTVVFIYLDIVEVLPTLTDIDSDGDLIPDNAEGYGDTDNDGIADYLDNNNSRCNIQTSEISEQELYLIETEPSICLRRGINTANNQSGALLLSVDEVINDNEAINVGGVFDFILSGLPIAGQSISLVLPQRLPIPENAIYRKLTSDNGWGEFAVDTNNYYSSAAGEIGYCPAPNDDSWTLGLTAGHWCVQLTIEDGGLNDDDGIANSRIVDPSGVAVFNNNNTLPEIMSEQVVTTQNKSVTIDVLANDIDSDGDSLSITSAIVDFGNVTIVGQQLHYQPDANFFGLATIIYGVSDGNNGTGFGDVAVNVIENTAPVTVDDSATTDDRTAITIDVLANDTDVDNDELTLISVSAEQASIIISNNMLVYTPLASFDGVDTVTYHISDNNGGESRGQVAITVNAYETIIITNKSSGGSFGTIILLLVSVMLFIRRKSTLVMSKTATGKTLGQCLSLWALLSLSISFSSYAAQAAKFDIFIKAELGQGKAKISGIAKQVPIGVITQIDNKATSWSIGVGTNITNDWSVTLNYVDMGEGSLAITGDTLIASEYHQSVAKIVPVLVKGIGLNGHYYFLQSEQYNASVLFGLLTWDSDVVSAYEDQNIDHDNDGIDMYYGIEGTYKVDEAWGVNAGIKRYALDVNNVDIAYLGLTYKF